MKTMCAWVLALLMSAGMIGCSEEKKPEAKPATPAGGATDPAKPADPAADPAKPADPAATPADPAKPADPAAAPGEPPPS